MSSAIVGTNGPTQGAHEASEKEISEKINIKQVLDQYMPAINQTLERWIPRQWSEKDLLNITGKQRYPVDLQSLNKTTTEPIWDLMDRGKRKRIFEYEIR